MILSIKKSTNRCAIAIGGPMDRAMCAEGGPPMIFELEMNLFNACAILGFGYAIIAAIIENKVTKLIASILVAAFAFVASRL